MNDESERDGYDEAVAQIDKALAKMVALGRKRQAIAAALRELDDAEIPAWVRAGLPLEAARRVWIHIRDEHMAAGRDAARKEEAAPRVWRPLTDGQHPVTASSYHAEYTLIRIDGDRLILQTDDPGEYYAVVTITLPPGVRLCHATYTSAR